MADRYFMMEVRISPWAKWIAQDEDGTWWEFSEKPKASNSVWDNYSAMVNKIANGFPPKDFTKELYEVK